MGTAMSFVPSWGATCAGARKFLIAYNVNVLGTKEQAHRIALNIRDQGRNDGEVVSGLSMGIIAAFTQSLATSPRAGAFAGGAGFFLGCATHHAHRHWLYYRLSHGW